MLANLFQFCPACPLTSWPRNSASIFVRPAFPSLDQTPWSCSSRLLPVTRIPDLDSYEWLYCVLPMPWHNKPTGCVAMGVKKITSQHNKNAAKSQNDSVKPTSTPQQRQVSGCPAYHKKRPWSAAAFLMTGDISAPEPNPCPCMRTLYMP